MGLRCRLQFIWNKDVRFRLLGWDGRVEHGAVCEGRRETMLVEGRGVELPTGVHLPHHKQTTLGSVCVSTRRGDNKGDHVRGTLGHCITSWVWRSCPPTNIPSFLCPPSPPVTPCCVQLQPHLVPWDQLGPTLVPAEETERGAMDGRLLKEIVVMVIVCGHLSTPPSYSNNLFLWVPLHALHHCRPVDRCIFQRLSLWERILTQLRGHLTTAFSKMSLWHDARVVSLICPV